MDSMNEVILKNLETFVAFTRKRVGDPHLAEDLVQESLVKALGADRQPVFHPVGQLEQRRFTRAGQ